MPEPMHEGDDLVVTIHVKEDDGSAKVLTGATYSANAHLAAADLAPTIDSTGEATGTIKLTWSSAAFTAGKWICQLRATLASERQTVREFIQEVKASYP